MLFRISAIIIFFFSFLYTQAADTIIVHKDPRIDALTAKQIAINKVTIHMTSNGLFKGYRLQVLNTRSRDEAFKTKAMLLENFPNQKVYILYQAPYFKVRAGNFINRADAENFSNDIRGYLSQPVYIVNDLVEYIPKPEDFQ
jgi:hypothetical protein